VERLHPYFYAFIISLVWLVSVSAAATAHEVRPGYIEIIEAQTDVYSVRWKQPVRENGQSVSGLGLQPVFPENCTKLDESKIVRRTGALIESFKLACEGGIEGQSIGIQGLRKTITDVFVRAELLQRGTVTMRLTPDQPFAQLAGGGTELIAYLSLGTEHLLSGYDHILFVIGLTLLVANWRRLLWVVTGFTLAHSFTLALSVMGWVTLPSAPVEAVIALSILFVAIELTKPRDQRSGIAERFPQVIAFGFGLIHGFGFAGVLLEIGLPRGETAMALALFNIGLELGQILVVIVVLALQFLLQLFVRRTTITIPGWVQQAPAIAIGAVAVYWLISRVVIII
jgi:hydrogenase/urease accessory protein HupE